MDRVEMMVIDSNFGPFSIGVSSRKAGDMSLKNPENASRRAMVFKQLEIEKNIPVRNRQVHSNRIIDAYEGMDEEADGIITDNMRFSPYILTADCYNIFFYTGGGKRFGIVHAGWRGVANGIVEELAGKLEGDSEVIVAQGICQKHFEVKREVMQIFSKKYGDEHIAIDKRESYRIDLRSIIEKILSERAEVSHIKLCNICENENLFSYRLNSAEERNLSIIWRNDYA